jgi:hypothetical protein
VTFTATASSIIVDPVTHHLGTASFAAPQYLNAPQFLIAPSGLIRSLSTINGTDPFVINFHESLDEVHIENRSAKDLVIDDIHVVNTTVSPTVTINAQLIQLQLDGNFNDLEDAFGFDVTQSFGATPIEILQVTPQSTNVIKLTGQIDNPVGIVQLTNQGGGIVANPGSLVRTNTLLVQSEKDVGSSAARLKTDLVRSQGKPTHLNINAEGQVWLDLRGVLRDPTVVNFVVNGGVIDGSNVDVPSVRPSNRPILRCRSATSSMSMRFSPTTTRRRRITSGPTLPAVSRCRWASLAPATRQSTPPTLS